MNAFVGISLLHVGTIKGGYNRNRNQCRLASQKYVLYYVVATSGILSCDYSLPFERYSS